MAGSTVKILPPTPEEIEIAWEKLYNELVKTESQPISEMRSADEVFAEKRKMLEELLSAKI